MKDRWNCTEPDKIIGIAFKLKMLIHAHFVGRKIQCYCGLEKNKKKDGGSQKSQQVNHEKATIYISHPSAPARESGGFWAVSNLLDKCDEYIRDVNSGDSPLLLKYRYPGEENCLKGIVFQSKYTCVLFIRCTFVSYDAHFLCGGARSRWGDVCSVFLGVIAPCVRTCFTVRLPTFYLPSSLCSKRWPRWATQYLGVNQPNSIQASEEDQDFASKRVH